MVHPAHSCMEWSECTTNEGGNNCSNNSSATTAGSAASSIGNNNNSVGSAPTIKNHSVTHFGDFLFCFGGYDGRRNHMTLLLYSLQEKRWIRPYHETNSNASISNSNNHNNNNNSNNSLNLNVGNNNNNGENDSFLSRNNNNNNSSSSSNNNSCEITVQGTPPPGRNGHSATLAAEDEENGRIIIIGGWLGTGPLAASDMHVLDVSNGGKQLRWYQPPMKGTPPGPCNMHSADYVISNKEVYVFRGGNGREYLNDLHALNVNTLTWRKVITTGEIPQQRANHSSAILEETGELFIFGGWNGTERLNDIHILDTATSNWTFPKIGGVLPHPRAGMTLTALRGRLYLFGGSGTSAKCFQDLQILDRNEMAWLDVVSVYDRDRPPHSSHHNEHNSIFHQNPYDDNNFRFGGNRHYNDDYDDNGVGTATAHRNGQFADEGDNQPGSTQEGVHFAPQMEDWRSVNLDDATNSNNTALLAPRRTVVTRSMHNTPNPNDEDIIPSVLVYGHGPGRRAGHTATAVNRKIYVFGGSCGSDYLNDFFFLDTDPQPRAAVSEPTSVQLLERRLRNYFNDEEFADVTFLVQGQKVYGHKMVLSIVSDCFRAMFTTGFRESEEMEIEIPDCSYSSFLAVMEYIYRGALPHVDLTNNSDHRSLTKVVEMLELADRFFLDHLKQICETILQPAVNAETVEYLLSVSQKTNAGQLQAICEHFMRNREAATLR